MLPLMFLLPHLSTTADATSVRGPPPPFPPPFPPCPRHPLSGQFFILNFKHMSAAQTRELNQIADNNVQSSKKLIQEKLNKFKSTLSAEMQKSLIMEKEMCDKYDKEMEAKVEKMSPDAKSMYYQLKALIEDDSLTYLEEYEKTHQILKKFDQSVKDEFDRKGVSYPGTPPSPPPSSGTPLPGIYYRLSQEEQDPIDKMMEEIRFKPKKEVKERLDRYIAGLNEDYKYVMGLERKRGKIEEIEVMEKVERLSEGAQKVYKQYQEITKDDTNTLDQGYEKLKAFIANVPQNIIDEFIEAEILLPEIYPFPPYRPLPPPYF